MHVKITLLLVIMLLGMALIPGCGTPTSGPTLSPPTPQQSPPQEKMNTVTTAPTLPPDMPTPLPLASPSTQAAAIVNGQPISLADFEAQVEVAQRYLIQQSANSGSQPSLTELRGQVLDWMIDQVLIEQASIREGITITDEQVEAEINKMRSSDEARFTEWLQANGLTVETLKARLRSEMLGAALANRIAQSIPSRVEQVHVRHILISTQEEAEEVLRRLQAGEDFAALATTFSLDQSTKDKGGDLGFLPRGIMSPEFDAVAFTLAPGETSGVVQSQYGYHIVQVIERDPAREVPPELLPALRQHAFQQWLEQERATADIVRLVQ